MNTMQAPTMTEQLQQILSLRPVKKAAFTKINDRQVFFVELHPFIMKVGKFKYRLPSIKLKFTLIESNYFKYQTLNKATFIHPHISRVKREICWGEAEKYMREALTRNDWVSFTHVLVRWAGTVDLKDAYTKPTPWRLRPWRSKGYRVPRKGSVGFRRR